MTVKKIEKKKIRLIGLDLDGTTLTTDKRLTPHTKEVLEACIRQGIEVLPATGRVWSGIPKELTDIEGVYRDYNDKSTLISELSTSEAKELLSSGTIGGGMLPKLGNCIEAIENGVSRVHILDGRIPHCLLLEIFTNKGIGTAILSDDAERFYNTNI